jgi:hypothetical protein
MSIKQTIGTSVALFAVFLVCFAAYIFQMGNRTFSPEDSPNNYSLTVSSAELAEHGKLEVFFVRLKDMRDTALQKRINDTLFSASTSWISGKAANADEIMSPKIMCRNSRYLSVVTVFEYVGRRADAIFDYTTVDLDAGERVFLDDLVNVDARFVEFLQKDATFEDSPNSEQFDGNAENIKSKITAMSPNELLSALYECSKSQTQVIKAGYAPVEESIGPLLFRNNFYIEPGRLVMVLGGPDKRMIIRTGDIADFLKVPQW